MASIEYQKNLIGKFIFKEKEAKLFIFKKGRDNPVCIRTHIKNVKSFIDMFNLQETDNQMKIEIFSKYFDEDIIREAKCEPSYETNATLENLEAIMIKFLEVKTSKISEAMQILEIGQFKNESIIDFARRIKIKCFDLKERKEEIMIRAFMNGMVYKRLAETLEIFTPKSLDEAVEYIKDEKIPIISSEDSNFYTMKYENESTKALRAEIEKLKAEIVHLKKICEQNARHEETRYMRGTKPITQSYGTRQQERCEPQHRLDERRCYACNKPGHIARFCKMEPINNRNCFNCGGNHLARFCTQRKLRHFQADENDDIINDGSLGRSHTPTETDNHIDSNAINMITTNGWNSEKTKSIMKRIQSHEDKVVQYINGQGAKPKRVLRSYEGTVISKSRPEMARNKPLVECKIGEEKVRVMFDTGADLNVISENFVEKLLQNNPAIRIYKSNTKVTCANGSTEKCVGKVKLNVTIGPIITAHVFDIMPNIFPHVFIGIRSMKKYAIMVNPAQDEIAIQQIRIPFVSKTIVARSLN